MRRRSQTSWACIPCATATGTSRPPAPPAGTASTRAWTGSPTSSRTRNDPFHLSVSVCLRLSVCVVMMMMMGGAVPAPVPTPFPGPKTSTCVPPHHKFPWSFSLLPHSPPSYWYCPSVSMSVCVCVRAHVCVCWLGVGATLACLTLLPWQQQSGSSGESILLFRPSEWCAAPPQTSAKHAHPTSTPTTTPTLLLLPFPLTPPIPPPTAAWFSQGKERPRMQSVVTFSFRKEKFYKPDNIHTTSVQMVREDSHV
ncbi:hypothetical protein AGOR_G00223200 [Albula goreensis]|uniref:Uncharacterized protein n=1 Tax=Albula goreensis TaxID=1534307 RepID=A0A8T3CKT9_9TELE|nr:hypothetical protein AGOR_G00223200 [Albula goreensis]